MDIKDTPTSEELEKQLAEVKKQLAAAEKEAKKAKAAQAAAEAIMGGGTSVREENDGMVSFWAFKDDNKYKDDIVVGINGKVTRIQRGKHVRIPREVYNVIRRSMAQDAATAEYIEGKAREYEAVKAYLN